MYYEIHNIHLSIQERVAAMDQQSMYSTMTVPTVEDKSKPMVAKKKNATPTPEPGPVRPPTPEPSPNKSQN